MKTYRADHQGMRDWSSLGSMQQTEALPAAGIAEVDAPRPAPLPPRQRQLIWLSLAVLVWAAALITGCDQFSPASQPTPAPEEYQPTSIPDDVTQFVQGVGQPRLRHGVDLRTGWPAAPLHELTDGPLSA